MRKMLVLMLVLGIATAANAYVLSVVPVDIGQSDGRLGTSDADALWDSDVIGLTIILGNNPYVFDGTPYPAYDGYFLSSMDVDLHAIGAGSITPAQIGGPPPLFLPVDDVQFSGDLDSPDYTVGTNGFDQITAISLNGVSAALGPVDLVWNILFHCEGAGDVLVDLTLNGLTEYANYDPIIGEVPYWLEATEADLGDLVIHQVPEPMTIALLGLGGLFLRRRK